MSEEAILPRAARCFIGFATLLRANAFAAAPEQTTAFLQSIALLGPRSVHDIRRAAHAIFAPAPERRAEFEALFDAHFFSTHEWSETKLPDPEEDMRVREESRGSDDTPFSDQVNETGMEAARAEALSARPLASGGDEEALRQLERNFPARAPRRRGYRTRPARAGASLDLRRALKEAVRNDGEIFRLPTRERRLRPRAMLLLVDVSGSMKERTAAHLRLAHVLAQRLPRIEIFTFGTRLTRVTRALKLKHRDAALEAASHAVSDWDGGTRIGDALQAFLALPRFAGYARGAATLILSDGLERGDPSAMRNAVERLSRRAWRLVWLSPLAAGAHFQPRTEAMQAVMPYIDGLADASSIDAICARLLALDDKRAA